MKLSIFTNASKIQCLWPQLKRLIIFYSFSLNVFGAKSQYLSCFDEAGLFASQPKG
jgi:hypothetical protein